MSEKSMNRQKELARNTMILTIGKICTQGISFFLLPLYTAVLSPDEYGIVDLFNTYISVLLPLVNWEFDLGLFRFMLDARNSCDDQKRVFSTVVTANAFQIAVYLLLFLAIQPFVSSKYKLFLAFDVVLNVVLNTLLQFSRGLGRNGIYSFASFLSASLTVVLNVILIAVFSFGVYGLFVAPVIAKVISIVLLILSQRAWTYYSIRCFSKEKLKQIFKYSFPLIPTQLSWWIVNASDRTIVTYFLGIALNGIYSVANKFSSLYITFYNIFNMSWTETVALHVNDDDRDEFLTSMFNTVFAMFSAICLGIIACMPFVYPILINEQYSSGYYQVPILMIAVLFQVVCGLYSVIYLAVKKSAESAKTALYAAIINVVVDVVLIKMIGLYAASVSTLVAYATMAICRYFDTQKYVKMLFNKRLLVVTIIVAIVDFGCVMYNNLFITILNFFIVVIYAIWSNSELISSCVKLIFAKIKRG